MKQVERPITRFEHVEIRTTPDRGVGVFALRALPPGESVVRSRPVAPAPVRDNLSLQMDWDRHVYFDEPGCRINHSCDPNTGVRNNDLGGYDFVALREIAPNEEITFDYGTTEYVSIAVSHCLCGTARCRGLSGGFDRIDADHPAMRAGLIAGYILRSLSPDAPTLSTSALTEAETGAGAAAAV